MAIGLKKRRRIQLIFIGVTMLTVASVIIGYAARDGIAFFRSPTQVLKQSIPASEVFRIGGLVENGTLRRQKQDYQFNVTDGNASIIIHYSGILPDLFREGQGVIATGRLQDGHFFADEILAKHDENYMPKEVADALKQQGIFYPNPP